MTILKFSQWEEKAKSSGAYRTEMKAPALDPSACYLGTTTTMENKWNVKGKRKGAQQVKHAGTLKQKKEKGKSEKKRHPTFHPGAGRDRHHAQPNKTSHFPRTL